MKKLIYLILFFFITFITYSQEEDYIPGKLKIGNLPSGLKTDSLVTTDNTNVLKKKSLDSYGFDYKTRVDSIVQTKDGYDTGLLLFGDLSINVSDNTKFDISLGYGVKNDWDGTINDPRIVLVQFGPFSSLTPTYLATSPITYIAIDYDIDLENVTVIQQASPFTAQQRRDLIILGAVIHSDNTIINAVNNIAAPSTNTTNQLHDLIEAIGPFNKNGNIYTYIGSNLNIKKTAGDIFKLGVGYELNLKKPHSLYINEQLLVTLRYRLSDSNEYSDRTTIDPDNYESSPGNLSPIPNGKFTIQYITLFQSGATRIQYGQNLYDTMGSAVEALGKESFLEEQNIKENGITRAALIIEEGTTVLNNDSKARFFEFSKFGLAKGGGGVALTYSDIINTLGYTPANEVDVYTKIESDNIYLNKLTGGNVEGNLIVDYLNSNTNIAGSNLTVKKQSISTSTNVAQFIDVDRQASSTPANLETNTFGLVSRVINNSTVEDAGVTGSNLVGRHAGSSNFNFAYGTINTGEVTGTGNGNFVVGTSNNSEINGSSTIDYLRGISSTTLINDTGATANYMQGEHNSLVFTNGTVGQASVMYLDVDGGSATVTGDLAYIRSGNDALPTVNGNSYFIKSESTLPSEFSGSISAPNFIGNGTGITNVDAQKLTNYNLGADAFTETLSDFDDNTALSGIYRVTSTTTNNPIGSSGVMYHMNSGATNYVAQLFQPISAVDLDRLYIRHWMPNTSSWSTLKEVVHTGNVSDYAGLPAGFYEEDTFTPNIIDSGGGATYSFASSSCNYVRTGNSVTVEIEIIGINTTGTPTGSIRFGNLPFNNSEPGPVNVALSGSDLSTSEIDRLIGQLVGSSDYIQLSRIDGNYQLNTSISSGSFYSKFTYITNVYTP